MKVKFGILFFIVTVAVHAQKSDFDNVSFKKADSIVLTLSNEELTNLPQLTYKLTSSLGTDVERFRAIYKWVCTNVSNNYTLYHKNKSKRYRFRDDSVKLNAWNKRFNKLLFKKMLRKKTTICTGYAYLVKAMADLANIECEIVHGYGKTSTTRLDISSMPNHSWNVVKLSGKWYLCDATWASGKPDPKTQHFKFNYNDGFFLTNPKLFAINHFPIEKKWWLLKDEAIPSFEIFLNAPIFYGKAYQYLSEHISPKQLEQTLGRNEIIVFEYKLINTIEKSSVKFLVDDGMNTKTTKPNLVIIDNKHLKLEHQFKNKGWYDVHLYMEDALIATYVFKVKR